MGHRPAWSGQRVQRNALRLTAFMSVRAFIPTKDTFDMSTYVPLSTKFHAAKRWKRPTSYGFAQKDVTAPIASAEFPQAVGAFPIAFVVHEEMVSPVVLLGFEQGSNLFVDNAGHWLGVYTPLVLRAYPFKLARAENNQVVLCIDHDAGLITDTEGEQFFDAEGNPSAAVKSVLDLLNHLQAGQAATAIACATLAKHGLLKPWALPFKSPSGPVKLGGIFQVDEQALNQLADAEFLELRRTGALPMAYCQLLSMMRVSELERLAEARVRTLSQSASPRADLPPISFADDMFTYE